MKDNSISTLVMILLLMLAGAMVFGSELIRRVVLVVMCVVSVILARRFERER